VCVVRGRHRVRGAIGTPAAATRLRAAILSAVAVIAAGDGPTQISPASLTMVANPASSDRNP